MDTEKFEKARQIVNRGSKQDAGIGTLKEGTLHAALKYYLQPDESKQEVKVGSYVADIMSDGEIVEIQTRAFSKLRKKLAFFLERYKVVVVYPVAYNKWISWINMETGEVSPKRKSPKKGTPYEIFFELYQIKQLLSHPNLSILIYLMDIEEYKLLNGWSKNKKRGSYRKDRVPIQLRDKVVIECLADYKKLIPDTLQSPFTSKDFKEHTKLSLGRAQTALNILHHVGAIERSGKKGNAYLYIRAKEEQNEESAYDPDQYEPIYRVQQG